MCPSAEQLLGQLAGHDRVVPIAFHVDYFNDPWRDPFSDPRFSRREMQYSVLYDRANNLNNPSYLYLTPLLMIDGRFPMLGTDDPKVGKALPKAKDAIGRALAERPGVSIELTMKGGGDKGRSLEVALAPLDDRLRGRDVLIEVVPFADRTSTRVKSGELAGRVYDGRFVARGFEVKSVTLGRTGKTRTTFSAQPPKGADLARDGLVVIVQDEATGQVHQAAILRWTPKKDGPATGVKAR